MGILDGELCRDQDQAIGNIERLLELVKQDDVVVLRLRSDQIAANYRILERLRARPHYLIIRVVPGEEIESIKAMGGAKERKILI